MRKRNPNDVVSAFVQDVHTSVEQWAAVGESLREHPVSLRRAVSRDAFFRLALRWELLRSDWHIAAAARDPRQLRTALTDEVHKALSGRPGLAPCRPFE